MILSIGAFRLNRVSGQHPSVKLRNLSTGPAPFIEAQNCHQSLPGDQAIPTGLLDHVKPFGKRNVSHANHVTKNYISKIERTGFPNGFLNVQIGHPICVSKMTRGRKLRMNQISSFFQILSYRDETMHIEWKCLAQETLLDNC
jgi:hypothetical protein